MTGTVPALSIVFMIITCAISFGVPIALFIYLRLVKKADIYPFFAGCTVMLLFAFILVQTTPEVALSLQSVFPQDEVLERSPSHASPYSRRTKSLKTCVTGLDVSSFQMAMISTCS